MVMSHVHQVLSKSSCKAQWKGEEDKADRGRSGKTTSRNGQAWSLSSPRGQWRTGKKMEKTGCKIICGTPMTLAVKGLMMIMMMMISNHGEIDTVLCSSVVNQYSDRSDWTIMFGRTEHAVTSIQYDWLTCPPQKYLEHTELLLVTKCWVACVADLKPFYYSVYLPVV